MKLKNLFKFIFSSSLSYGVNVLIIELSAAETSNILSSREI